MLLATSAPVQARWPIEAATATIGAVLRSAVLSGTTCSSVVAIATWTITIRPTVLACVASRIDNLVIKNCRASGQIYYIVRYALLYFTHYYIWQWENAGVIEAIGFG